MDNSAKAAARRIAKEARRNGAVVTPALVESTGWVNGAPSTVVNVGGVDFTNLPVAGEFSMIPGQTVNVLQMRGQMVIIGPVSVDANPAQGTISSTGSGACEVMVAYATGSRTISCPWVRPYEPLIGDTVLLQWYSGSAVIVGALSQALPAKLSPPYTPVRAPSPATAGTSVFTANDSGTLLESGVWLPSTQLVASIAEPSIGFWFYGTKIKDSLAGRAASASVPLQVFVDEALVPGNFELFLHTAGSRAAAVYDASTSPSVTIPGVDGPQWVNLPAEWAAALLTSGGGIGIQPAGETASLAGIGENTQSGALRITWFEAN